jgi:hypothetical protein
MGRSGASVVSCIGLAALGSAVTEAPRGESAFRAFFGSGASLTHRPEKRQQMDLIKLIDSYLIRHTKG